VRFHLNGHKARGFTLIEVVVALMILATSGLMLFAWINQNLETASRLRDAQARAQLQIEGVSWLGLVNPSSEPQGERRQGDLHLSWTSTPVEPPRNEFNFGEGLVPRWELGLYRVRASLQRGETGPSVQWEQLLTGWRRATYRAGTGAQP
jgi:general secretion pathway protein I